MATPVTLKFVVHGNSHTHLIDEAESAIDEYFSTSENWLSESMSPRDIKYEIFVTKSDKESFTKYQAEVTARFRDE